MAFTEDLSLFFADFGVDATLSGQPVRGIFDRQYALQSLGDAGISGAEPAFTLTSASVPAAIFGATLVIPGQGSFTVREAQPDGTGLTVLMLQSA